MNYELVEVEKILFPKNRKQVNVNNEGAIVKFKNGHSGKFYDRRYDKKTIKAGDKLHILYYKELNNYNHHKSTYKVKEAISVSNMEISKFIETHDPTPEILYNFIEYGLDVEKIPSRYLMHSNNYLEWINKNTDKTVSFDILLGTHIYRKIGKFNSIGESMYDGYTIKEVKEGLLKYPYKNETEKEIEEAWEWLINKDYVMHKGAIDNAYFPFAWTD